MKRAPTAVYAVGALVLPVLAVECGQCDKLAVFRRNVSGRIRKNKTVFCNPAFPVDGIAYGNGEAFAAFDVFEEAPDGIVACFPECCASGRDYFIADAVCGLAYNRAYQVEGLFIG